jgi:hypothetical protein
VMALRSDRQKGALKEAGQAMVQWWLMPAALSLLQEVNPPNSTREDAFLGGRRLEDASPDSHAKFPDISLQKLQNKCLRHSRSPCVISNNSVPKGRCFELDQNRKIL